MPARHAAVGRLPRALLIAACLFPALAAGAGNRIAVLPLAAESAGDSDGHALATAVRTAAVSAGWDAIDAFAIDSVLKTSVCNPADRRADEACVWAAGDSLRADFVLAGTLIRNGAVREARFKLYARAGRSVVWSRGYRSQGGMPSLMRAVPGKVAAALPLPQAESPLAQELIVEEEEAEVAPDVQAGEPDEPPVPAKASEPGDDAIARAPAIGVQGIATLGEASETQSVGGGYAFLAYPTTKASYLRVKLGMPLYHNRDVRFVGGGKLPDPYLGIDHEWGWPKFAIGFGLAYMYLNRFDSDTVETMYFYDVNGYSSTRTVTSRSHFEPAHAVAIGLNLRGGKPNAGFYGRIAWPLPYILYDEDPDNFFFEYSAFGVYGRKNFKAGLGIAGMFKTREADYVDAEGQRYPHVNPDYDTYEFSSATDYADFSGTTRSEFFSLVPCLKVAVLVHKRIVITGIVDLGGTVLPRVPDIDMGSWKPSLGLNAVYSFGDLAGPDVMDGSF